MIIFQIKAIIISVVGTFIAIVFFSAITDGENNTSIPIEESSELIENIKLIPNRILLQKNLGAGINVDYQLPKNIATGEVVDIEFTLSSRVGVGTLSVSVQEENLEVLSPLQDLKFNLEDNQEVDVIVSIYSGKNAHAYVNLFITLETDQKRKNTQILSIPITIGESYTQEVNKQELKTIIIERNTDNLIRSMPAQETITTE